MRESRAGPRGSRTKETEERGGGIPSKCKRIGESRAEAIAGKDAGNKYVRERESFSQTPDARCNGEKLASERGKRDTRASKHGRRHTERQENGYREILL